MPACGAPLSPNTNTNTNTNMLRPLPLKNPKASPTRQSLRPRNESAEELEPGLIERPTSEPQALRRGGSAQKSHSGEEGQRWFSGLMTRLSPKRSMRREPTTPTDVVRPLSSPIPERPLSDSLSAGKSPVSGASGDSTVSPPRHRPNSKWLDKLGLSPRATTLAQSTPVEGNLPEGPSPLSPTSPLSSTGSGLLVFAARIPSRCTEEDLAGSWRGGSVLLIDALVEGWDEATRKVDVAKVETYEDLLNATICAFPELEAYKNGTFVKVVSKERRRPTEMDPADLRDSSELPHLLLLIKPWRPVMPIMLTVDNGSPHPKFAELLYFCPDYASLVQWVMQQFPITRRHLQGLVWGGCGLPEAPLTEATDWKELRRACRYVRVVTGYDPEDKASLLEEWKRSLQRASPPAGVKRNVAIPSAVARDRVLGLIHGAVLGAVMGAATNGRCSEEVPAALKGDVMQVEVKTTRGRGIQSGDWPKAFDPFFLTMESLVRSGGEVCQYDVACTLARWCTKGLPAVEHRPPAEEALDPTDRRVLTHGSFLRDPAFAADCVVQERGLATATNGVLLRVLCLGCIGPENAELVKSNTEQMVHLTHGHTRCLAAASAVVAAVRQLLTMETVDPDLLTRVAYESAAEFAVDPEALQRHVVPSSLDDLELDDSEEAAAAYKAMGCGMYCLRTFPDFKTAIRAVMKEGGNAEVNAAVAGALLGCRLGYSQLPKDWLGDLRHQSFVKSSSKAFLRLLHLY